MISEETDREIPAMAVIKAPRIDNAPDNGGSEATSTVPAKLIVESESRHWWHWAVWNDALRFQKAPLQLSQLKVQIQIDGVLLPSGIIQLTCWKLISRNWKNALVFETPQVIAAFLSYCGNKVSECREANWANRQTQIQSFPCASPWSTL